MQTLLEDIQFAWVSFVRTPVVCALIVITLALGIGANAAIFSMVHNVLLAPLPFAEGERLVKLKTDHPGANRYDVSVSVPTALDYIEQNSSLTHLVEYHQMPFTLLGHGDAANVEAGVVSWDFFEMLGVPPLLGRTFLPGEDLPGAKHLIVLSHRFWREKFAADPTVVGMKLEMNQSVHQVIGVMPPLPAYPFQNDIWIGSASCPGRGSNDFIQHRDNPISQLYGKLKPNVALQKAEADFNQISASLQNQYSDVYPAEHGLSNTLTPMKTDMAGQSGPTFYLLMGLCALVLLISCANVANLNLARMARRKQELAIRKALGANPGRITRQVLTESVLLALVGGGLGLLIAYASMGLLSDFAALYTPLASEIKINASVLLFCLVVSVVAGILGGAASILQKEDINTALKEGSGNITTGFAGSRLRNVLLVAQFSLSFVVLVSACLVSLSLYRLNAQDIGFDTANIVTVDLSSSSDNRRSFVKQVAKRLEAQSGIDAVAFSSEVPLLAGRDWRRHLVIEGHDPANRVDALKSAVSANFHQVLNIPLVQGRYLNETDSQPEQLTALINQAFAKAHFPAQPALGKRFSFDGGESWLTIVGVVGDVRDANIATPPVPTYYVPWTASWHYDLQLLVAGKLPQSQVTAVIRDTLRQINPRQAIADIKAFDAVKARSVAPTTLVGILVSSFALLAFVITLGGLIGVMAYNVSQRRKEIGIMVTLGANPGRIRKLLIVQGLTVCVSGLVLGAIIMVFITPLLSPVLFATDPLNPVLYVALAGVVILTAVGAILWPVRQAIRIEPVEALREQ